MAVPHKRARWILLALIYYSSTIIAQDQQGARDAFLAAYKRHIKELDIVYSDVFCKSVLTTYKQCVPHEVWENEIRFNDLFYSISSKTKRTGLPGQDKSTRVVEARNSKYSFTLHYDESDQAFVKTLLLEHAHHDRPICRMLVPFMDVQHKMVYSDLALSSHNDLKYMDNTFLGKTVKSLVVRNISSDEAGEFVIVTHYHFLPSNCYICLGKEETRTYEKGTEVRERWEYEYEDYSENMPKLKTISYLKSAQKGSKLELTSREEISQFENIPQLQDKLFRLTAFGLPEPEGLPQTKLPQTSAPNYYYYAAAVVLVCLLLWYMLRRKRVKVSVP